MKTSVKTLLKTLVSVGLLSYLIYLAEPQKILEVLNNIWNDGGIIFLGAASLIFIGALWIFAMRWQILVKGYGLTISTVNLFKYYLMGLFFNNFLPTGIGGDVIRIYNIIQESGERTIGFASVLTERLLGITGTLILTIVSIFVLFDQFENLYLLYLAFGLLASIIFFFIIVFNDHLLKPVLRLATQIKILRLGERLQKFFDSLRFYRDQKTIYLKILLFSLLGQVLVILMSFMLVLALNLNIGIGYMFFVVPITFLLTMLPSINGIGFRDGGFVVLLGTIGITKAAALSLSFLTILVPMFISIWGGILFMMQKKMAKNERIKFDQKII